MKKSFLTKIMMVCTCLFGTFMMASCQSTDSSKANFVYDSKVELLKPVSDEGAYVAKIVIGVDNPTIYNINGFTIHYNVTGINERDVEETKQDVYNAADKIIISHGASGYLRRDVNISKTTYSGSWHLKSLKAIEIELVDNAKFQGVWDTYFPWWIFCFVLLGISTIIFSATIFKKNISIENASRILRAHIASSITTLCFVLIICLFPLIFSGWVVTMILLGTFIAHFVIAYLLCALKSLIGRRNIPHN